MDWAKEWTIGAAEHAAHTDKMGLSMKALAKAHGVSAEASNRAVEAVKKVGFGTQDAIHAVDRLIVADMNLSKAEGLAKVAKDAAAIENISPGEALEKLMLAIESGASRGLSGPWECLWISTRRLPARKSSQAGPSTKTRFCNSGTTPSCARRRRFKARLPLRPEARRRSQPLSPGK